MERRNFVKTSAIAGAATLLPRFSFAQVKGSDLIKVGVIGCGGRGTGAACDMIAADQIIKIIAMADLFEDRLPHSKKKIAEFCDKKYPEKSKEIFNIDTVKTFFGWDCVDQLLKEDVDVVIDASPPVFRTPNYAKIVEAGKHAFLEKPACVDITQARQMLELSKKAKEKGLSVVCGNQRRYSASYQDVIKRVQDGEIGDIMSAQCYWNGGYYVGGHGGHEQLGFDTMEYQIRKWSSFIWPSGDHIVEQHVHNIDVIMWAFGDKKYPLDVRGWGGRSADEGLPYPHFGDRFSHFSVDYDMGNGIRFASYCQQERGASGEIGERIVGTKGIFNSLGGCKITDAAGNVKYAPKIKNEVGAYVAEHQYLMKAIRNGTRVNRLEELVNSTLVAIAGRMSAFSGQKFKYAWVMAKSTENLLPKELKFGKYPLTGVPVPGKFKLI